MVNTPFEFRPTIFLDTNTLHYMSSYLRWAEKENLPPFKGRMNLKDVEQILLNSLPQGIVNHLLKGARALAFLQQQVIDHDAAIYTSRFAKAEVIYGVLEGQAHARMAREGLPYRMRQRAGVLSELVSMYLESEDYEKVMREWDNFLNLLEEKGRIVISYAEDESIIFHQIFVLAEFILSRIFIDVMDSWMYACALVMNAEMLITFDDYFRGLVDKLHNPQCKHNWLKLQNELKAELSKWLPGQPSLPKAVFPGSLPKQLPEPW